MSDLNGLSANQIEAVRRELERMRRINEVGSCLSADNLRSKPTSGQEEILRNIASSRRFRYVLGGNQCLASGTLVRTAHGNIEIEKVQVGDVVYDPYGNPIEVTAIHFNGLRLVADLIDTNTMDVLASCTARHKFALAPNSNPYNEIPGCSQASRLFDTKVSLRLWDFDNKIAISTRCRWGFNARVEFTYDITVNSGDNLYCLANGLVTHNSGKSSIMLRDLSWFMEELHPYWERPGNSRCNNKLCGSEDLYQTGYNEVPVYHCKRCGNVWREWNKDEPLISILCGESRTLLTNNLWDQRLRPLMIEPRAWRENKMGNQVLWLENVEDGRKIFLFPHGQGSEQARKAIQGWSIHYVGMDELAPLKVIEELTRRRDAKMGYFISAFTMKTMEPDVVRYIRESTEAGISAQFRLSKLDNPVYAGDRDRVLAELAGLTEEQKNTILYGDISGDGDDRIFAQFADFMKGPLPPTYSTSWRHVEIVDPAIKSKAGYLLVAQDPATNIWHTVKAKYITGMQDAVDLVHACEAERSNYNVQILGSDNMAYFIGAAAKLGIRYRTPPNKQAKTGGKLALIKRAQTVLNSGRFKVADGFKEFWDELYGFRWKEGTADKIINEHKYHIIDCMIYLFDLLPRDEIKLPDTEISWIEEIRRYNMKLAAGKSQPNRNSHLQKRSGVSIIKSVTGKAADRFYKSLGIGNKHLKGK